MKKVFVIMVAVVFVATGTVFAMGGGEGNNTYCNGLGNPNSPCEGRPDTNNVKNNTSNKNVIKNNVSVKPTQRVLTNVDASSKNKLNNSNKTTVRTGDVDASSKNLNANLQGQKQGQDQSQRQNASSDQKQRQQANNEGISTIVDAGDVNIGGDDHEYYNVTPPATTPLQGTSSVQATSIFGGVGFSKDSAYMVLKFKMDEIQVAVERGFITEEEGKKIGAKLFKKFIKANKKGLVGSVIDPLF